MPGAQSNNEDTSELHKQLEETREALLKEKRERLASRMKRKNYSLKENNCYEMQNFKVEESQVFVEELISEVICSLSRFSSVEE